VIGMRLLERAPKERDVPGIRQGPALYDRFPCLTFGFVAAVMKPALPTCARVSSAAGQADGCLLAGL
jgi:hypothetical protein